MKEQEGVGAGSSVMIQIQGNIFNVCDEDAWRPAAGYDRPRCGSKTRDAGRDVISLEEDLPVSARHNVDGSARNV